MKRERKSLKKLNLPDRFLFAETIEDPEAQYQGYPKAKPHVQQYDRQQAFAARDEKL